MSLSSKDDEEKQQIADMQVCADDALYVNADNMLNIIRNCTGISITFQDFGKLMSLIKSTGLFNPE